MANDLYDGPCEAGCQHFHGGEIRHHPDCGHYPESLTKLNADTIEALQAENARLKKPVTEIVNLLWAAMGNQEDVGPHGGYIYMKLRAALQQDKEGE